MKAMKTFGTRNSRARSLHLNTSTASQSISKLAMPIKILPSQSKAEKNLTPKQFKSRSRKTPHLRIENQGLTQRQKLRLYYSTKKQLLVSFRVYRVQKSTLRRKKPTKIRSWLVVSKLLLIRSNNMPSNQWKRDRAYCACLNPSHQVDYLQI